MKPLPFFAAVGMLVLCLGALVAVTRIGQSWALSKATDPPAPANTPEPWSESDAVKDDEEEDTEGPDEHDTYRSNPFTVSKDGAQPRVEVVEEIYHFEELALGMTGKHDFIIRNIGQAPLKLAKGPTQCKCTMTGLKDREIPPGGEATLKLEWKPVSPGPFAQTATIYTNDPEKPEFRVGVEGEVKTILDFTPQDGWQLGTVAPDSMTEFRGAITSTLLEDFKILGVETTSDETIKLEVLPFSDEEKELLEIKSGYKLLGEYHAGQESGKKSEFVTVLVNLDQVGEAKFPLTVTLTGPLLVLAPGWFAAERLFILGDIDSEKGKELRCTLMIEPAEQPLEFLTVQSKPGFIEATLKPEQVGVEGKRERYTMTLRIPPGSARGDWPRGQPARMVITTNHPKIPEVEFNIEMLIK